MRRPLIWIIAAMQLVVLTGTAPLYARLGLTVDFQSAVAPAVFIALIAIAATATRGGRDTIPEMFVALLLLVATTAIIGPAQYVAAGWNRPLIDPVLARADAILGVWVPAITDWTAAHPWLQRVLMAAYFTLVWQFLVPIFLLGAVRPDPEKLWEYVFHFNVCAIGTLIGLALWPAACVFTFLGRPSLIDQTRFIAHFTALRSGTFSVIRFGDIEGLVSFPSFHIAGAWLVTWACRKHPRVLAILIPLNVALCASTVLLGAHYAVDVLATAVLCAGSHLLYRALPARIRKQPRKPVYRHQPVAH